MADQQAGVDYSPHESGFYGQRWRDEFKITFGPGALYFPHLIGQGFFFRSDVGLAYILTLSDRWRASNMGLGALLGVGYGIPVRQGRARILLQANVAGRYFDHNRKLHYLNLSIGGLL